MHTQIPYYQFLTSLLYLQLDLPLGCWGCHCSLIHQNKYWLGTLCSHAGGQVLLSAMSAKSRLDTTSPCKYFVHFYCCSQVRQCSSFSMGHFPTLQMLLIPTWVGWFLRVNHLPLVDPTVRCLFWDFGSDPVVVNPCNSCKGGVLDFGVFFCYWYWLIMAQNMKIGCLAPKAVSLATLW